MQHHIEIDQVGVLRDGYRRILDGRVLPRWRHVAMGKLAGLVRDRITELGSPGMSATNIRQIVYVFSAVCQYAIRTGRLVANPAAGLSSLGRSRDANACS